MSPNKTRHSKTIPKDAKVCPIDDYNAISYRYNSSLNLSRAIRVSDSFAILPLIDCAELPVLSHKPANVYPSQRFGRNVVKTLELRTTEQLPLDTSFLSNLTCIYMEDGLVTFEIVTGRYCEEDGILLLHSQRDVAYAVLHKTSVLGYRTAPLDIPSQQTSLAYRLDVLDGSPVIEDGREASVSSHPSPNQYLFPADTF